MERETKNLVSGPRNEVAVIIMNLWLPHKKPSILVHDCSSVVGYLCVVAVSIYLSLTRQLVYIRREVKESGGVSQRIKNMA